MDNPKKIAQYYLKLLKAFKSVKEEMGEGSPSLSFEGASLDEKIEEAQGFLFMNSNPLAYYVGFSIEGYDSRIYSYDKGGLKILINIGKIGDNEKFYSKLMERITFPLIIADQYGNSVSNKRKDF